MEPAAPRTAESSPTALPHPVVLPPEPTQRGGVLFASIISDASEGLRFEFARNQGDDHHPFALLSEEGRYSRVLLGRVVSAGGTILRDVAVKIQRDDYADEPFHHIGGRHRATNPSIDNLWRREYESLNTFSDGQTGVVQLLDLFYDEQGFHTIAPVLHCHKRGVYFHVLCPECGEPMRDCRDEQLLQAMKTAIVDISKARPILESYQDSTRRALYCEPCCSAADSIEEQRLYIRAWNNPDDAKQARGLVKDRFDLWRDYEESLSEGKLDAAALPCVECPERATCFKSGASKRPAAFDRIVPLSFYEFYALPLDCLHIQYNYAIQVIGGRPFSDIQTELARTHNYTSGQAYLLSQSERSLSHEYGRLTVYTKSMPEQYTLEVLLMKLSLFHDICLGLNNIHSKCKSPHLDLKPQNIMVKVGDARKKAPSLWSLSAQIIDLASAKPYFHDHGHASDELFIFEPPSNLHEHYTSPVMMDGENFGFRRQGDLHLSSITRQEDGRYVIEAVLRSEGLNSRGYSEKDAVAMSLAPAHPSLEEVQAVFSVKAEQPRINELYLRGAPLALEDHQFEHLLSIQRDGIVLAQLNFWKYKCFHIPCDLYSMGVLLLQTLLETAVVEEQTPSGPKSRGQSIAHFLPRARSLSKTLEDEGLEGDEAKLRIVHTIQEAEERWVLSQQEGEEAIDPEWCSKVHLFYRPSKDNYELARTIPDDLWQEAILIAFRMMTNIRGFSYCASNSDFELESPESIILKAISRLEVVIDQVHARLFGLQGLARPVHQALDQLVGEERLDQGDPFQALGEGTAAGIASEVGVVTEAVMRAGANSDHGPEQVSRQIRGLIESKLGGPVLKDRRHQLAFSIALRERFPYLTTSAKAENRALNEEIVDLQHQVSSLLSVTGQSEIHPERMNELSKIAEVCSLLIDHVSAIPQEAKALTYAKKGKRIPRPKSPPINAALAKWAAGEGIDIVESVRKLLDVNGQLAARLMVAYRKAIEVGVENLRTEALNTFDEQMQARPRLPREAYYADLRRKLDQVFSPRDSLTGQTFDIEDRYFWDGFERGFEGRD